MKCICYGFSQWKRRYIKQFVQECDSLIFLNSIEKIERDIKLFDKILVWGLRDYSRLDAIAQKNSIDIIRVEDGFIRSLSLGSDLTAPYSLVFDDKGIYFDPRKESKLEYLLNNYIFDNEILNRASDLINYILKNGISKYNISSIEDKILNLPNNKNIILIPGQVEDDASIIYGAKGMNNIDLIREVRKKKPNSFIIYKPHPDVVSGNRKGKIDDEYIFKYCDMKLENYPLSSILDKCNEVHTLTSLVGFEALIRNKKVYTYGIPFYAGWGLTKDRLKCQRRNRKLTIEELAAASLILYPRYLNPVNGSLTTPETLLKELSQVKYRYNNDKIYRFTINIRNKISRILQKILKVVS